jgi:hypothetical protein
MYRKRKTITIPVEYNEVVVPFSALPDDTDMSIVWNGKEVGGEHTDDGLLLGTSRNAEEQVIIEYDWKEEKDTVSPVVNAIKESTTDFDIEPLVEAVERVVEAVENKTVTEYNDGRVVSLLQDIQKTLQKPQEKKDYTAILERIIEALETPREVPNVPSVPVERETLTPILEEIKTLLATQKVAESAFPMNNGRIKVEVDRAGVGGLTSEEAKDLRELNEKQDALISAVGQIGGGVTYNLKKYAYNIDADLEYQGKNVSDTALDSDTDWEITKYIYVEGTNTESITKTGSWTGRVALFT